MVKMGNFEKPQSCNCLMQPGKPLETSQVDLEGPHGRAEVHVGNFQRGGRGICHLPMNFNPARGGAGSEGLFRRFGQRGEGAASSSTSGAGVASGRRATMYFFFLSDSLYTPECPQCKSFTFGQERPTLAPGEFRAATQGQGLRP